MSRRAWIAFASISVLWGVPYLFIEIAVEGGASPLLVGWGRVAIGALILLPLAWRRGYLDGMRSKAKPLVVFAIVECGLPWWLIPLGQEEVSSSLAAILIASLPILVAVVALRVDPAERVTGSRLAGLGVGIAGVVLLLGIDIAGRPGEIFGAAAILAATVSYAVGLFIIKRHFADVNPIGAVALALGISTVLLAPAGIASIPGAEISGGAVASIGVLGSFCSALALVIFFTLVAEVGPMRTSVITYVNPAVAVVLGVVILGESLGPGAVAGLLLILAGSWLSTGGGLPPGGAILRAGVSPFRWTPRNATPKSSSQASASGSPPSDAPPQPRASWAETSATR